MVVHGDGCGSEVEEAFALWLHRKYQGRSIRGRGETQGR
jgi:hypothetical protein